MLGGEGRGKGRGCCSADPAEPGGARGTDREVAAGAAGLKAICKAEQ